MPVLSRRAVVALATAGTIAVTVPVTLAATSGDGGTPANKAVAAGSKVQDLPPDAAGTKLMSATLKTSKTEDLLMSVSLECSIITDVLVAGSSTPGNASTGEAAGAIRVWLTLDGSDADPELNIVPITAISAPPQDGSTPNSGDDTDKVTFCDRDHKVTLTDKESPQDGTDELREYQFTKSANDFNWVRLNAGSGMHVVRVWAQFVPSDPSDPANTVGAGANTGGSVSTGYVGNRTLIIEPTKLANNAVISDSGTSTAG